MLVFFLALVVKGLYIELFNTVKGKYLTKQSIGDQSFEFQVSLDTNILMVLDSSIHSLNPSYNSDQSKTFQIISPNSELCWSMASVPSTSECSYAYKSDTNYTNEGSLSLDNVMIASTILKDFTFGRITKENIDLKTSGILGIGPNNLDALYGASLIDTVINVFFN